MWCPWPYDVLTDAATAWNFSNYMDDSYNYLENSEVHTLKPWSMEHLTRVAMHNGINVFEPVSNLFKAFEIDTFSLNARNLRIVTFSIHSVNAILLALYLCLLFEKRKGRNGLYLSIICLISFFWWIHPLNIEVVGWLSAQGYALALFQLLLSSIFLEWSMVSTSTSRRNVAIFFSLACYASGCMTKAPAVMLAPVHLFRLVIDRRATTDIRLRLVYPALLILTSALAIRVIVLANTGNESEYLSPRSLHAFLHSLIKACHTIAKFTRRVFWPFDLRAHYRTSLSFRVKSYDPSPDPFRLIADHEVSASIILLLLATFAALSFGGLSSLGWLGFCCFWIPGSGIVPHGWSSLGADRYSYIASAYLSITLVVSLLAFLQTENHDLNSTKLSRQRSLELSDSVSNTKFVADFPIISNLSRMLVIALIIFHSLVLGRESRLLLLHWRGDKYILENCLSKDALDVECRIYIAEHYGKHENNERLGSFHREEMLKVMPLLDVKDYMFKARTLLMMGLQVEGCRAVLDAFDMSKREGYWNWAEKSDPGSTITTHAPLRHLAILLNNLLICEAVVPYTFKNEAEDARNRLDTYKDRIALIGKVLEMGVGEGKLEASINQHLSRLRQEVEEGSETNSFTAVFYW